MLVYVSSIPQSPEAGVLSMIPAPSTACEGALAVSTTVDYIEVRTSFNRRREANDGSRRGQVVRP